MPAGDVLWHITKSLDGFITGPDDAMEWAFGRPGAGRVDLERTDLADSGQLTDLRFRVVR